LGEKTKHRSDKKLKPFLALAWLNQGIFSKTKPRTRMAAVFTLQQRKTVRVLQCLNLATVTHQEYGQGRFSPEPKTSAWKRREQLPSSCPEVVMPGPGLL